MTTHFKGGIDDISADEILEAWISHGRRVPGAFIILSEADMVAHNIWNFLQYRTKTEESIQEFCKKVKEKDKFIKKLKEVIELWQA